MYKRQQGALWCWGRNSESQLGLGDNAQRTEPQPLNAGSEWSRVSAGAHHTCALRSDRTLWCWGDNAYGQLGLGDKARRADPTEVPGGPWLEVAAGVWSTCVIDQQRGLHCFGQVAGNAPTPRRVGDIADAANVSVGSRHACALRGSGALWCWGQNGDGQLGQGDTVPSEQPVEVQLSGG